MLLVTTRSEHFISLLPSILKKILVIERETKIIFHRKFADLGTATLDNFRFSLVPLGWSF